MIQNYRIVVGVPTTNLVKNGYYPCSYYSLTNLADIEFVDEVICADGGSSDQTRELHEDIEKVRFFDSAPWNTEEMTQTAFERQLSSLVQEVDSDDRPTILIICFSDNFVHKKFEDELERALYAFIKASETNVMPLPIAKMLTREVRENQRPVARTFDVSAKLAAIKFNQKFRWHTITGMERKLLGSARPAIFNKGKWDNEFLSYENWFFTNEHYDLKRKFHEGWRKAYPPDMSHVECIKNTYLGKRKGQAGRGSGLRYVNDPDEHPHEAQLMFKHLTDKHLGHSFFGIDFTGFI